MEQIGILVKKWDERSGVSQRTGNNWKNAEFLLEVPGQYPTHISFTVADGLAGRIAHFEQFVGKMVVVQFEVDAREYNGRWYNDVKAWGCREYVAGQAAQGGQGTADETGKVSQDEAQAGANGKTTAAAPAAVQTRIKQMAEAAASGAEGKEGEADDLPF